MVIEKLPTKDKEVANQAKLGKGIWDRDRGQCTGKVLGGESAVCQETKRRSVVHGFLG